MRWGRIFIAIDVIRRLLPLAQRYAKENKTTFSGLRSKYRWACKALRLAYNRGYKKGLRDCRRCRWEERQRVAQRMLKLGLDDTTISKATGLTRKDVANLRGN